MLTRYLYWKTEVEASLTRAILTKHDIKECYYWANELKESGFEDIYSLLWKIYYDYYFEYNPKLETFMRKNKKINNIILNLFKSKHTNTVFIIQNTSVIPQYLSAHPFLNAVVQSGDNNIVFYFNRMVQHYSLTEGVWKYFDDCQYHDKRHYLIALIVQLECSHYNDNTKMYISRHRNEPCSFSGPLYRVLSQRKYQIHSDIGCFNICNIDWKQHWEFYAKHTPYWIEKFQKAGCCFHGKQIIFSTDNELESFYEKYGYEPDEQSKDTLYQKIPIISYQSFYEKIEEEILCNGMSQLW